MTVKQRTFPSPIADPDTEQFWTAAKDGKLMVGSCNSCGENITIPEVSVLTVEPKILRLLRPLAKARSTLGAFYVEPIPPSPSPTLP